MLVSHLAHQEQQHYLILRQISVLNAIATAINVLEVLTYAQAAQVLSFYLTLTILAWINALSEKLFKILHLSHAVCAHRVASHARMILASALHALVD